MGSGNRGAHRPVTDGASSPSEARKEESETAKVEGEGLMMVRTAG